MNYGLEMDAEGIIMGLENSRQMLTYFDCDRWSDFPCHSEKLFIGGFERIQIESIYEIGNGCDYSEYIQAMKVFESCISGRAYRHKILNIHFEIIIKLIRNRLKLNVDSKSTIPVYISKIFDNLCENVVNVKFDIALFEYEHDFVYKYHGMRMYGYRQLKNVFFHDNIANINVFHKYWIKLNIIKQLFSNNCKQIDIVWINRIQNKYEYKPSIIINDTILMNILCGIKQQKEVFLNNIIIRYPNQTTESLMKLVKKYNKQFDEYGYNLFMIETPHSQLNDCPSFRICKVH